MAEDIEQRRNENKQRCTFGLLVADDTGDNGDRKIHQGSIPGHWKSARQSLLRIKNIADLCRYTKHELTLGAPDNSKRSSESNVR